MISITIGTNTQRKAVVADVNDIVRDTLTRNDIEKGRATVNLNGTPLTDDELDCSFAALGVADESTNMLICVVKADSAR